LSVTPEIVQAPERHRTPDDGAFSLGAVTLSGLGDETTRRIIFRGVGEAVEKCVSCAEVFKRKHQQLEPTYLFHFHLQEELYQWNALSTAKRVTYWDPIVEGMNRLKVTIDTPAIFIMLSRDPYPVELQCMSMQQSSSRTSTGGKSAPSSFAKRGGNRRPQQQQRRPNKWARPAKGSKDSEAAERQEALEKLEKAP
uniref:Alba domain-containing protein n=1 Tax=Heligmosomoides polygyrus TaxID=6339 RepID=A0A183GTW7_HELPZ